MVRGRRAFTLIELVVVIIIIAVVSSIIVPAYSRMVARERFRAEVVSIEGVFERARREAVREDTVVQVRFDPAMNGFVTSASLPLLQDAPAAMAPDTQGGGDVSTFSPVPRNFRVISQPPTGSGSSANDDAMVTFQGDGTATGAQFALQSAAGASAQILVWPATGSTTAVDDSGTELQ